MKTMGAPFCVRLLAVVFLFIIQCKVEAQPAVFRGQVLNRANGLPVENARVVLNLTPPDATAEYETQTDLFGFFTITNTAAGAYEALVEHRAYSQLTTNVTFSAGIETNKVLKLTPIDGKVVFDIFFNVWCLATQAELSGSAIQIEYWEPGSNLGGGPNRTFTVNTGPGGTVTAANMEDGFYRFKVTRSGWKPLTYTPPPDAGLVVVGDKVRLIRTHIAAAFLEPIRTDLQVTVTGYDPVKDAPDSPLKGMVLKLTGVGLDDPTQILVPAISALSLEDGTYTFRNLPPIQWEVLVGKLGYETAEVLVPPDANGSLPAQNIAVVLEPTKVKVTLSSLYGTNSAVSRASVKLEGIDESNTEGISRNIAAEANPDGSTASALFENLLPGRYYIRVKHNTALIGLPNRSGVLFGPSAFSVDFFARESFAEVIAAQTEEAKLELEPIPARIQGRLFATDELGNVETEYFDPEPNRIFHRMAQDGIVFTEHEVIQLLKKSFVVDTDASGNYTILVPPGIFGVQIPGMANYTGHNVEFGNLTTRTAPRNNPWPYPNRWPHTSFEGGHHGAGLRFDSGNEYQLDLFVHAHYINLSGVVSPKGEPFGDLVLALDQDGITTHTIAYSHLRASGARVVATGPTSTSTGILDGSCYVLKKLKPGTYTITIDSPEYTTPPVQVTIAPWQAPGIIPATAPMTDTYFFPGITHFEGSAGLEPEWKAKGEITVVRHNWIVNDPSHYSSGSDTRPGFFRMTGLPNRVFRFNSFSGGIPSTDYTIWSYFFDEGWFTGSGSGTAEFHAFLEGPTPNVFPNKAPTVGGYTLDLHAYSEADRSIEIPDVVVQFPKGPKTAGGEVPHQDSPQPTGATKEGWFYVRSEVSVVNPDTRLVRVDVLMRRAMVVSGVVTNVHGAVPNTAVVARNRYGWPLAQAVTGTDGTFRFQNMEPQAIYLDVSRRGYIPQRKRFDPPSVSNPDITATITLEDVPAPIIEKDKFTMNRFGLFLPGVLKTEGPNPISPGEAREKLTATWKAEARETEFPYTLDGFMRPDETQGPAEEFTVKDRVTEIWIVDRRAFKEPFVKDLSQQSDTPVVPPGVTNYLNVMKWIGEINAGVKDGQPYHVVHQLVHRGEGGMVGNQFKGEFPLWELPSGVFKPRIVAITENGGVAIADYELPADSGTGAKVVPLQGMNMPSWMSGLTEFIAAGKTFGTVERDQKKIHAKYGEGFMKVDPNLNFTASITLSPMTLEPEQNANITYKYGIGVELSLGGDTSESGPLATGPRFLGTKLTGISVEFEVVGGDQEAALGLGAEGPEKELPLDKLKRFVPAMARSLPVALAEDGECPDVLVCIIPPSFKASAKIGASETLDSDWLGNNVMSAYSFILEGMGMFDNFGVNVKLDPILQKLPYVGPFLAGLEKIGIRIGANAKFKSSLGAKVTYKHVTYVPKPGGTMTRGEQGERWDLLGRPSDEPVGGGSTNTIEFNVIVKIAAGLGLVGKIGSSADGPKVEGTGWLQLGAPKQSNNPEGMYFQIHPTLGSPLIQKATGAFSFVGEVTASAWVISYSKSWQFDIAKWEKDFTAGGAPAPGFRTAAAGTAAFMELTPIYITTTIINPTGAKPHRFVGKGGTIVEDAYRKAAFSVSKGTNPLFAFATVDPTTGLSKLQVSTRSGDQWNAPAIITTAGGIISVAVTEDPAGGWIALWSEIEASDLTNPYAGTKLKYSSSANGTTWSTPATILTSPATMFGLEATVAGEKVLVSYLSTTEGPLGEKQTLNTIAFDGLDWSAPMALLPPQGIAGTELNGQASGGALLAVTTAANELLVFDWSGSAWAGPQKLSTTADGAVTTAFSQADNGAIAWKGPEGDVLFASRAAGSTEWSAPIVPLDELGAGELQLAAAASGNYLLAWTAGANVNSIFYAISDRQGQIQLMPTEATIGSTGIYQKLQIRPLSGGRAALVAQYNEGTNSTITEIVVGMPTATDCNGNGVPDADEIASGAVLDCNGNGVPDTCEIVSGLVADKNENGIPDSCEAPITDDCNRNGISDAIELRLGFGDVNENGVLDDCESGVRIRSVLLAKDVQKRFYRATTIRVKSRTADAVELEFEGNLEQSDAVTGPWTLVP